MKTTLGIVLLALLCLGQGSPLHRVIVADGSISIPCDEKVHSQSITAHNAGEIVGWYMFVGTNAEWFDAWIADPAGDVIGELHQIRDPYPLNSGAPAYNWWQRSDHGSWEPDYFNGNGTITLSGWCDTTGTEMLPYGQLYSR